MKSMLRTLALLLCLVCVVPEICFSKDSQKENLEEQKHNQSEPSTKSKAAKQMPKQDSDKSNNSQKSASKDEHNTVKEAQDKAKEAGEKAREAETRAKAAESKAKEAERKAKEAQDKANQSRDKAKGADDESKQKQEQENDKASQDTNNAKKERAILVEYSQSGGFVNITKAASVKDSDLKPADAAKLKSAVEKSGILQITDVQKINPAAADVINYDFSVVAEGKKHHANFDDTTFPSSYADLREFMVRLSKPVPLQGH